MLSLWQPKPLQNPSPLIIQTVANHTTCTLIVLHLVEGWLENSKECCQKDKEAMKTPSTLVTATVSPKHKVQVTTSTGQAYAFLSTGALQLKSEFVGVIHSTDALEWNAFDSFANLATVDSIDEEEKSNTCDIPL
jgi:hypothetical protein